ncbi:MAG: plasmid maintenance system antidote protein VapI [Cyclobacteriaceae bacterium]|jgi:plasmid maintenance system antidote protein VapI
MKTSEIEPKDIWNEIKRNELKDFISEHAKKQSKDRLLTNKLLSIQYKMEDYIRNDNEAGTELRALDFVKMYLTVLNISKRSLAQYFEMKDGNLHKYLSGERKMNAEIAMKLSSFSHTKPEQWFGIQVKNELLKFNNDKKTLDRFKRYDYKNLVKI